MRDYEPYFTEDGSIGLYSYADKDVFHSKFGALTEAWEKFIIPSDIEKLLNEKSQIKVLDICYGIGYNTKALMSFILNKKNKNLKNKFFKNFSKEKISKQNNNTETIDINKKSLKKSQILSLHNETIDNNNSSCLLHIDCLEINKELIELSPLFKTIITPGEIYTNIVPEIFDCLSYYYSLKNIFERFMSNFSPRNRKEIKELLDLKFKIMHLDKEYRLHPYVNQIIINRLSDIFSKDYPSKNIKKILSKRQNKKFFDKNLINYMKFNHFWGYKLSCNSILSTFLHNIYYSYLSIRSKNMNFKLAESLFNIHFHTNDARKTILSLNDEYDCIFLDAFTYTKAPQLWSMEFIAELYKRISPDGLLLTYSTSAQIRNTLLLNNFYVGKIYNVKTKRVIGTIASKDKDKIKHPLSNYEIGLCNTKAGIPYHDPNLSFSNKDILELREYDFRHSNLMSSSKYMKLRSNNIE